MELVEGNYAKLFGHHSLSPTQTGKPTYGKVYKRGSALSVVREQQRIASRSIERTDLAPVAD